MTSCCGPSWTPWQRGTQAPSGAARRRCRLPELALAAACWVAQLPAACARQLVCATRPLLLPFNSQRLLRAQHAAQGVGGRQGLCDGRHDQVRRPLFPLLLMQRGGWLLCVRGCCRLAGPVLRRCAGRPLPPSPLPSLPSPVHPNRKHLPSPGTDVLILRCGPGPMNKVRPLLCLMLCLLCCYAVAPCPPLGACSSRPCGSSGRALTLRPPPSPALAPTPPQAMEAHLDALGYTNGQQFQF